MIWSCRFFGMRFFFATCFRKMIFFCAKKNFSSHLATTVTGSANPGYLWSKYECFLMSSWWDILQSSCLHVKLWSNFTNRTEVRTNIWTERQKLNAGGIKNINRSSASMWRSSLIVSYEVIAALATTSYSPWIFQWISMSVWPECLF